MELKFGSVWLLLSCSLQQSLWGILASVPHTNAKKCTHKISSEGEPVKKVQMIRRIPARCSGWDEAWSWISKMDCRTKYKLDYVELPSAVQKVEDIEDCEPEVAAKSESTTFDVTDEKLLAIAFGSVTVALLIVIVIIVISVKRGHSRCSLPCVSGPSYTSANSTEREHLDEHQHACNEYVDEGQKLDESEYEEIMDPALTKKKLGFNDDPHMIHYQNGEESSNYGAKMMNINGVNTSTVIPSAPYEEDLQQTVRKSVSNDYSIMEKNREPGSEVVREGNSNSNLILMGSNIERNETQDDDNGDGYNDLTSLKLSNGFENDEFRDKEDYNEERTDEKGEDKDKKESDKKCHSSPKHENVYSKFDDLVHVREVENEPAQPKSPLLDYEEPISAPVSSHSYENLDPDTQELFVSQDYESLVHTPVDNEPAHVCSLTPQLESDPITSSLHVHSPTPAPDSDRITGSSDDNQDNNVSDVKMLPLKCSDSEYETSMNFHKGENQSSPSQNQSSPSQNQSSPSHESQTLQESNTNQNGETESSLNLLTLKEVDMTDTNLDIEEDHSC